MRGLKRIARKSSLARLLSGQKRMNPREGIETCNDSSVISPCASKVRKERLPVRGLKHIDVIVGKDQDERRVFLHALKKYGVTKFPDGRRITDVIMVKQGYEHR